MQWQPFIDEVLETEESWRAETDLSKAHQMSFDDDKDEIDLYAWWCAPDDNVPYETLGMASGGICGGRWRACINELVLQSNGIRYSENGEVILHNLL